MMRTTFFFQPIFLLLILLFSSCISSFKLHKSHECSKMERKHVVFDSSSDEDLMNPKGKNHLGLDDYSTRPTTFNMKFESLSINIFPGFGLQHHPKVSTTFQTAKNIWETLLEPTKNSDPVNIIIDVQRLEDGVLGSTQNSRVIANCIEPSGVFPQPMESKTGITFPDCSKMKFELPENITWDGKFTYEKAHLKALGYNNLDYLFGKEDGQIVFSLLYLDRYDLDVFDGVDANKIDFLSVAIHEIGHLLGFSSSLDEVDFGEENVFRPSILDVFRFSSSSSNDLLNFEEEKRYSKPDKTHQRFFTPPLTKFVEFSTGLLHGDGNQASHWKDDEIIGNVTYGVMDPTLSRGVHIPLSTNDVWAFRSLGYGVNESVRIEVLNHEVKLVGNYPKLFISAEFVFSSNFFIHYFRDESEVSDYSCRFDEVTFRWICPYPRSNLCQFRVTNSIGKISRKISVASDTCHEGSRK